MVALSSHVDVCEQRGEENGVQVHTKRVFDRFPSCNCVGAQKVDCLADKLLDQGA